MTSPTATSSPGIVEAAKGLIPLVAEHADECDRLGHLSPPLVEAFTRAGIFHWTVPRALGGPEVDFVPALEAYETISEVDGSAGWVAMIGSFTGALAARFPAPVAREMLGSPRGVFAGSATPRGKAFRIAGGYRVSGKWPFASGCHHSSWLYGSSVVIEDGELALGPDGMPRIVQVYLPASQATILDTWHVAGMRGTGSNDFAVDDLFVPDEHTYDALNPPCHYDGRFWRFGWRAIVNPPTAAVALGIARHALDSAKEVATKRRPVGSTDQIRDRTVVQVQVAEAEAILLSARLFLYRTVTEVWDDIGDDRSPTLEERGRIRLSVAHAMKSAQQVADLAFHSAGSSAVYESYPLERCWRDIMTLSQHVTASAVNFESTGRVLLGLDPGTPIF